MGRTVEAERDTWQWLAVRRQAVPALPHTIKFTPTGNLVAEGKPRLPVKASVDHTAVLREETRPPMLKRQQLRTDGCGVGA